MLCSSPSTLIREAVVCVLQAAGIPGLVSVNDDRSRDYQASELPAANVMTGSESVEIRSLSPRVYERRLEVMVDLYAERTSAESASRLRDDLGRAVELALLHRLSSEGLGLELDVDEQASKLVRLERDVDHEGRQLAGALRLVLEVAYLDEFCSPDQALAGDFEELGLTHQIVTDDPATVSLA